QQLQQSSARITHTYDVLRAIDAVNLQLTRAESAQRAFLVSNRGPFLTERDEALDKANAAVASLKTLAADNAAQLARIAQLEKLIGDRVALMHEFAGYAINEGIEGLRRRMVGNGQRLTNQMYQLNGELANEELGLLEARRVAEKDAQQRIIGILIGAGFLCFGVLIPAYFAVVSQVRARERAEAKLVDLTDSLPGAVFRINWTAQHGYRFEYLSKGVETLRGADRAAAMADFGAMWQTIIEEDRPAVEAAMTAALKTRQPANYEFRVRLPDGTIKWLLASASLRQQEDGSILWNGYWSDISAQKQLEQRMAEAEARLSEITNGVPGVVYQFRRDADGGMRFTFLSDGVRRLLGMDGETLKGDLQLHFSRVLPEYLPGLIASIDESAQSLSPWKYEYQATHGDGRVRWLSASSIPHREADGSTIWNGYWMDITESKELEDSLTEARQAADVANRAKSTFLATMSHEIRTPMNGVLGMIELLSLGQLSREQRTTVEIVRDSGKSLLRIIDDILDFAKIEAGKLDVNPEVGSIEAIVRRVAGIYTGNASSKGLMMKTFADPGISPAVWIDAGRVQQVLNNLVSNAIKFTSRGEIDIRAELVSRAEGEDTVRFVVRDTGSGIAADAQQRLFEPFTQGERHTAQQFGGSGLGLSISRRLAEMMGGSLRIDSTVGYGTTAILTLPLPIADARDLGDINAISGTNLATLKQSVKASRAAPSVEEAVREHTLVLVVDDHPVNCLVMLHQVNAIGYAAETASNGAEGLKKWQSGRFALVITDCSMPIMDGYGLAQRIRAIEAREPGRRRTPIIACTANAMSGDAQKSFAAGMDDHLLKPVDLANLMKKLHHWLPINHASSLPVDRDVLATVSGGNSEIERKLVAMFRQLNDEDVATLKRNIAEGDTASVLHSAHRILGAGRMLGANGLVAVCERLEAAGRASDMAAVHAHMPDFHREVKRVYEFIDQLSATEAR
ncbi:MAG: response regulator, partial [Betaproteobacteria bacterium]|nr:response regulator [Betaproteobacteria bacterium]